MKRNLKHVESLLCNYDDLRGVLNKYQLNYLQDANEVYRQQRQMHSNRVHLVENRIVSIHQPRVRPMLRGKEGADVEFGSKIGICVHNGLTYLDRLSWESHNETEDLKTNADNYKKRIGFYPAKINADQIFTSPEITENGARKITLN